MEIYIIILKENLECMSDHVLTIVDYLGSANCSSTYYNYYRKYNLKTRDISFTDYCPLSIQKKTNNVFKSPLIMALADDVITSSFNKIEARLSVDQISYLKTLDYIEEIRKSPKITLTSLSDKVGDNTKSSFVNYNPNTNFGLQPQNKDFENYKLDNIKIFNYLDSPDNTTYKYNFEEINNGYIDIIVIDDGIHGNHQNFIINGENICKIDEQPRLPWQLSKLYSLAGIEFIPGSTPEGVSSEDPNFVSYFTPPQKLNKENTDYNHGTHVAGIVCGANTGWIRSNKVSLYSINFVSQHTKINNELYDVLSILLELAILDFHINKINNGNKIPTIVNRSYTNQGDESPNDQMPGFSNFSKIYHYQNFYTYYDLSNTLNLKKKSDFPFYLEIQKKFGIVNVFGGGNQNELQLKWSEDTNDYFNYYLTNPPDILEKNEYYTYPYIPRETCLKEDLWTIGGLKLSELTYQSFSHWKNGKININYDLIKTRLNNNRNNIYKIVNEKPPTIIVGGVGMMLKNTVDYLNKENVGFLSNYIIMGFSSFGDALIYSICSNIRSSWAYNEVNELSNNLYNNKYGTSFATPNITGILSLYLVKLYSNLNMSVDKIMTDTPYYIQNYIDHNQRDIYKNLDSTQYPNKNEYFYKDIQLIYELQFDRFIKIDDIYPLSISPLYKIYCPVLFYDRNFINPPPIEQNTNELIAVSSKISALVQKPTKIVLKAKNTTIENYAFIITRYPKYGSIIQVSNSFITYIPNTNIQDSFQYVVREGSIISPPATVIIYNYNQNDIKNIPRQLGTFTFNDILFNGNEWIFGTIRTDTFIIETEFYRLGNYRLKN